MKIITTVVALMFAASLGAAQDKTAPAVPAATKDLAVTTISVPTIQCNMCVKTITKALTATDGVGSAEVDLKKKTTTVTYDSTKTDLKKLEQVIAGAGYDANNTKRDMKAYEKLSPCCKMDDK